MYDINFIKTIESKKLLFTTYFVGLMAFVEFEKDSYILVRLRNLSFIITYNNKYSSS